MMGPRAEKVSTYLLLLGAVLQINLLTPTVLGHGNMLKPTTWFDSGGLVGMKPHQQCSAGSELPLTDMHREDMGVACQWFNNYTFIPGEATLDSSMSTFPQLWNNSKFATTWGWYLDYTYSSKNPWFSPGSAPLYSPCGVAGGNPYGCPEGSKDQNLGYECLRGGWAYGPKAEDYYEAPGFPDVVTTEWKAGDVVEAAWGISANHGGGYAYRLCKVPEEGMGALTEECFQQGHLEFFGNKLAIQTGENVSSRVEYEALRTKEGTFPKGSQWTRNPVPNCLHVDEPGLDQGHGMFNPKCPQGTQFPPLASGLCGYGHNPLDMDNVLYGPVFNFSIVDQLKVPSHLTPGDYVLSFRWDCEQTSQIYAQCSNIKIVL